MMCVDIVIHIASSFLVIFSYQINLHDIYVRKYTKTIYININKGRRKRNVFDLFLTFLRFIQDTRTFYQQNNLFIF